MTEKRLRHPLKNFFVKKSIQMKIIWQIFLTVILSAGLTTGLLVFLYHFKSREGSFYYMSNNVMQDLELKNILEIILPSIIFVEIVAILIAFGIGLISSRRIAVPIFKIEKWASRLKSGKLNTSLAFRQNDHLNELTTQCNELTDFYKTIFTDINRHAEAIASKPDDPAIVAKESKALQEILKRIEL